jgi:hypothetical protein
MGLSQDIMAESTTTTSVNDTSKWKLESLHELLKKRLLFNSTGEVSVYLSQDELVRCGVITIPKKTDNKSM